MNLIELDQALRKLRLSGMADVLETRLQQAQVEQMAPLDLVAVLVTDELQRRQDRLLARRHKQARFRDPDRALDGFDFAFNKKIDRALVFELATRRRSATTAARCSATREAGHLIRAVPDRPQASPGRRGAARFPVVLPVTGRERKRNTCAR